MFIKNKKYLKIKLIVGLTVTLSIFGFYYLFINNNSKKQQKTSTFQFSHPDDRPDTIKGKRIILKRLQPSYFKEYMKKFNYPQVTIPLHFQKKLTFQYLTQYLKRELNYEKLNETF